ncbi:HECT-domain (ubiquitin-transferase) [Gracilaria domingensis]|nr:HECT-domain (ubiquitin-transferase) [Gracilaria domingensis]
MFDSEWPFCLDEVRDIASVMKDYLYMAIFVRPVGSLPGGTDIQNATVLRDEPGLIEGISRLLSRLHACDSQRAFRTDDNFWLAGRGALSSSAFLQDAIEAGPEALLRAPSVTSINGIRQVSYGTGRKSTINGAAELLRIAPFLIPFSSRAKIFQNWIAEERKKANGGEFFFPNAAHRLSVRRNFVFQDAYRLMNGLGPSLKSTIRVKFIDEHGIEEAGIDGGGVFKEFMHEVLRIGFSPYPYGLFKATPDGRLYPNPDAPVANEDFKAQFAFLGRLLGKAVFDGVLVYVPLAQFFLSKMLGQFNYPIDLGSLDPELYKNMKFLKSCDPSLVEDLGLNFTVANNAYGSVKEVELVNNGGNIPVTGANRIEYMHRVSNYRMNTQIREQSEAFLRGFSEVVPSHFIRLFSPEELQLLISGKTGQIDLRDLQRNTNYSGGYDENTPVIKWFWEVMAELDPEDQSKMLKFVTSSPRAPLLGFSYLVPSFCIHRAEGDVRLPTASTCMNLLKLPQYKSLDVVRDKIRYALDSNAGFDLS